MMTETHGLRGLHMGEARHDRFRVLCRLSEERALQVFKAGIGAVDRASHPEPQIGRHLVVARARGVQPAGHLADNFGKARLHI